MMHVMKICTASILILVMRATGKLIYCRKFNWKNAKQSSNAKEFSYFQCCWVRGLWSSETVSGQSELCQDMLGKRNWRLTSFPTDHQQLCSPSISGSVGRGSQLATPRNCPAQGGIQPEKCCCDRNKKSLSTTGLFSERRLQESAFFFSTKKKKKNKMSQKTRMFLFCSVNLPSVHICATFFLAKWCIPFCSVFAFVLIQSFPAKIVTSAEVQICHRFLSKTHKIREIAPLLVQRTQKSTRVSGIAILPKLGHSHWTNFVLAIMFSNCLGKRVFSGHSILLSKGLKSKVPTEDSESGFLTSRIFLQAEIKFQRVLTLFVRLFHSGSLVSMRVCSVVKWCVTYLVKCRRTLKISCEEINET